MIADFTWFRAVPQAAEFLDPPVLSKGKTEKKKAKKTKEKKAKTTKEKAIASSVESEDESEPEASDLIDGAFSDAEVNEALRASQKPRPLLPVYSLPDAFAPGVSTTLHPSMSQLTNYCLPLD